MREVKDLKIAVFHAFLSNKGGAEKVAIDICKHYNADLIVGGIRSDLFHPDKDDAFSKSVFHEISNFTALHEDAKLFGWRHIKRQLFFMLSPKVNKLDKYDVVIFSGNVAFVQNRIRRFRKADGPKLITYCHTPPRPFSDQREANLKKMNPLLRPIFRILSGLVLWFFKQGLLASDLVISNSQNIQKRLKKYTGIETEWIYPPIDTHRFKYIFDGDFYLSHSRLEDIKRIKLIVNTFLNLPNERLVICSTGPLKDWIREKVINNPHKNIDYKGLVSNQELERLVGTCRAGITIPVDEDAGITQCEIMSAGKPVLGVAEGGLLQTIIHKETGYLVPANPNEKDMVEGIRWIDSSDKKVVRKASEQQAEKFASHVFFDKMTEKISNLYA